jgi:biopolymer transport protein ExbD
MGMATMKLRKSRAFRKGRIEIIPMIDVMFFLLATFMLSSLSMQNLDSLQVNLPQGSAEKLNTKAPVTLTVTSDSQIYIDRKSVTLDTLAETLKPLLQDADQKLIVSADNDAPQGIVVQAMLQARAAGAQHFLIAVKHK